MGQTARFERFLADLVYVLASERKIDEKNTDRFWKQVDEVYKNPFKKGKEINSTEEIKGHVLKLLQE